MKPVSNQSVKALTETLVAHLQDNGYSACSREATMCLARHLSDFMKRRGLETYDDNAGAEFLCEYSQRHAETSAVQARLFIARINAILHQNAFLKHRKFVIPEQLPADMEELLTLYKRHCERKGLSETSLIKYDRHCRQFLKAMADGGVGGKADFTVSAVSAACLRMPGNYVFPDIRRFLSFLYEEGELQRDYAAIIPKVREAQPMPSVYSVEEMRRIEAAFDRDTAFSKRNYAMTLLMTRLGVRPGDIAELSLSELDFQSERIRFVQQKTRAALELPMPPAVRDALADYIQNVRGDSSQRYVFLSLYPPRSRLSSQTVGDCLRDAVKKAGIVCGNRRSGPRSIRSSVASSMVNDNAPYEVVRRTLGHRGKNAIKSYAKLDVEQLRAYSLEPPEATGCFAEFLSGRRPVK